MKKYEINIHKLLRDEKEKHHLSLRQLANRINGVSVATLCRLLKYPENDYTFATYKAIAEYFGKTVVEPLGAPEIRIKDLTVSDFKKLLLDTLSGPVKAINEMTEICNADFISQEIGEKKELFERKDQCPECTFLPWCDYAEEFKL